LVGVGASVWWGAVAGALIEHAAGFFLVEESVAVGVEAFKALFEEWWGFVFGELAVVVGVGLLEAAEKFFGALIAGAALAGAAFAGGLAVAGATGFAGAGVSGAAGRTAGAAGEDFVGGELAVVVSIELEKRGAGADDFGVGKLAVAIGVEGGKEAAAGGRAAPAEEK